MPTWNWPSASSKAVTNRQVQIAPVPLAKTHWQGLLPEGLLRALRAGCESVGIDRLVVRRNGSSGRCHLIQNVYTSRRLNVAVRRIKISDSHQTDSSISGHGLVKCRQQSASHAEGATEPLTGALMDFAFT